MKIATDKGNSKLIELFNLTQQENDKVSEGSHEKFDVLNIKTLDEVINILNEAVKHNDYEQLDEVINNIDKDDVFMSGLNSDNFKAFCSRYLNLDLQKGTIISIYMTICCQSINLIQKVIIAAF